MQSFVTAAAISGRYPTPNEVMSELAEIGGVVQALDQDNVSAVTAAKVAADAWGEVLLFERSTARSRVLQDTTTASDLFPIPNDADTDWFEDFACGDGVLGGTFSINFDMLTSGGFTPRQVFVGVTLDGALVATSQYGGPQSKFADSIELDFATPIGAGTHRIAWVFGTVLPPPAGETNTVTFNGGSFFGNAVTR